MRKYISLIYFLFAGIFIYGQVPGEIKWKENIVKNNIHTQIQWNHKYVKGKPERKGYKNFSKTFDRNGNVTEEVYYKSGYINKKMSYKYDNNNNKIEFVNYKGNANKVMFKQNITYDNSKRKTKEERYNGVEIQIIKYTYDNKNRLIKTVRSDDFGDIEHQRIFHYSNNICTVSIIEGKSAKIGKIINKYDSHNNIIESTEYDSTGTTKEKYTYTFEGNLVKEKTKYLFGKFSYKKTYSYDSNNNLVKILKEQPKGKIVVDHIYKYDSRNNLIKEEWFDNNPKENSRKTYFYNSKGILEKVEVYYYIYKYKFY